ncbi:hypothetical protein Asp14428_52270 [Actinoplanes sp. NBRC 14428]|nr:hypothetical protein Asp14428_52270 [Actinoplanes sp. NBRC 14428]
MNELEAFRAAARKKGMPDGTIERWLRLARPCLSLNRDGGGPVAGYFGGRPALPSSAAWPERHVHLASIELAALPREGVDLDLPRDGTLVFLAVPGPVTMVGRVIHVPAGAAVAEAEPSDGGYERFPLYAAADWSLPEEPSDSLAYEQAPAAEEDAYSEIVWDLGYEDRSGERVVLLGGYGTSNTGGLGIPVGPPETDVLLAQFYLGPDEVGDDFETDLATLYFMITRADLAARRFENVSLASDFHG